MPAEPGLLFEPPEDVPDVVEACPQRTMGWAPRGQGRRARESQGQNSQEIRSQNQRRNQRRKEGEESETRLTVH